MLSVEILNRTSLPILNDVRNIEIGVMLCVALNNSIKLFIIEFFPMSISHHLAFDHKNSVNVLPIANSSDISHDE